MLSLEEVVNWLKEQGKAFWPRLANLKEENKTEAKKRGNQTTETEDKGLIKETNKEEKGREIEDVAFKERGNATEVKDKGTAGGDESLQGMDKENHCLDGESHAMEEGELKEHSVEEGVEDMMKEAGGNEDKEKQRSHDQDVEKCVEDKEPDAKKRKVTIGDKKLLKKQAKKAKGEKRRVRQRRAKQVRNSFLSTQGNLHVLQSGRITEQETAATIKELKSEVLVIRETTTKIDRKLQTSLLNQVFFVLVQYNHKY